MTSGLTFLIPLVGILAACAALGVCRASYYRAKAPAPRPRSHRALTDDQRAEVLATVDSDGYAHQAPAQSTARCSTTSDASARSGRCIACSPPLARSASAATSGATRAA